MFTLLDREQRWRWHVGAAVLSLCFATSVHAQASAASPANPPVVHEGMLIEEPDEDARLEAWLRAEAEQSSAQWQIGVSAGLSAAVSVGAMIYLVRRDEFDTVSVALLMGVLVNSVLSATSFARLIMSTDDSADLYRRFMSARQSDQWSPVMRARFEGQWREAATMMRRGRLVSAVAGFGMCVASTAIALSGFGVHDAQELRSTLFWVGGLSAGMSCLHGVISLIPRTSESNVARYDEGLRPMRPEDTSVTLQLAPAVTAQSIGLSLTGTF